MRSAQSISKKLLKAKAGRCFLLLTLFSTIVGCATTGISTDQWTQKQISQNELPEIFSGLFGVDEDLYLFADADATAELILLFLEKFPDLEHKAARIITETGILYAGISDIGSESPSFTVFASGTYRTETLGLGLAMDSSWKRRSTSYNDSRYRWWHSEEEGIELAIISNDGLMLSNGDPQGIFRRWTEGVTASHALRMPDAEPQGSTSIVVLVNEFASIIPEGIPPNILDRSRIALSGSLDEGEIEFFALVEFENEAGGRIAGLLLRTVTLAQRKKDPKTPLAEAEVEVHANILRYGPIRIAFYELSEYISFIIDADGGGK